MKKRLIIVGIVVLVIGIIFIARKSSAATGAKEIKTARVIQGTFTKNIQSSGKTKAKKSAELKFQTSGRLAWVGVKEGDTVSAGQAIAGLDSREVYKTLEKSLRDYSAQRNTFEQTWRVTYNEVQDPTTAPNDTVRRILEKNQWDLEKAVLDVELKHLALEYATLITPIAGIVVHIDTPVAGVNVTPAGSVFEIVDPDSLIFDVSVDEIDVGSLTLGQKATISLDAFPSASFSGSLAYIAFASKTSAGGATIFPVEVVFDAPQKLRIGLNGDVTIESAHIDDAVLVLTEAIREDDGGKYVYRKIKNNYTKAPVTIGLQNDTYTVVLSGLSPGEEVVTKGFASISK